MQSPLKRKMRSVHPGEILLEEVIIPNNLSIEQAGDYMGISRQELMSITKLGSPITPIIAEKISLAFGGSAELWLRLQQAHDRNN